MDVSVKERKVSFTSEYNISTPYGDYFAKKQFFSFTDNLDLTDAGGHLVAKIVGEMSPLRHVHSFTLSDGRECRMSREKILHGVYVCEGQGETYRLYEHRGLDYSIFKNERQIAAFTRNRIVFGKGNEYEMRMDHDADLVVVLCMLLTLNSSENDDEDSNVTIEIGHILEDRPVDASWEPR